jgi:hypothetical protein
VRHGHIPDPAAILKVRPLSLLPLPEGDGSSSRFEYLFGTGSDHVGHRAGSDRPLQSSVITQLRAVVLHSLRRSGSSSKSQRKNRCRAGRVSGRSSDGEATGANLLRLRGAMGVWRG